MAKGDALRSLYAEVGFLIEDAPLKKLDKLMDEIKKSMLGSGVSNFEKELDEAGQAAREMSKDVDKTTKSVDKLGDEEERTAVSTRRLGGAIRSMGTGIGSANTRLHQYTNGFERFRRTAGNAISSVNRGLLGLGQATLRAPFTLPGLITGGAAAYGVGSLVKTSIGGAAELELQALQLEALTQDAKKAKRLFEDMNRLGLVSVFSERDFLEGAKAFLPLTKDIDQINQLARLQERLAASNPTEGMAGAAFSIREALSGDTVSLVERFNIPRSMVENLKKATTMMGKIQALDKILNDMGYTQEYLTKVNEAAASQWDNLGSNIRMSFARSGKRALEELKPFLRSMNEFFASDRAARMFDRWGEGLGKLAREATNFGRWLIDEGSKAFDYIDRNYLSNPEFQKLPFNEKIDTVFTDIKQKFDAWYNGPGKSAIESGAQRFVDFTLGVLGSNLPKMVDMGTKLASAIGQGLLTGFDEFMEKHPLLSGLITGLVTPGPVQLKAATAVTVALEGTWRPIEDEAKKIAEKIAEQGRKIIPDIPAPKIGEQKPVNDPVFNWLGGAAKRLFNIDGSHETGLPNVPFDGYLAELHRGERVLTAEENKRYMRDMRGRETSRGGEVTLSPTINVYVSGNGGSTRVKEDARAGASRGLEEFWKSMLRRNPPVLEV
ncbi:hypothetical protein IJ21_17960 [Paenibacillus sp. 32O-W]|uniref:hypothetical protein n=1 Tax=Paenibacillus sp. 32O-W TaxID=1695218 RepID=UPI00071FEA05|nr:hypothetical protein [Paenibacillus sp. 32O-W]ALS27197.1 hypothetical protein IJ21_17960 [Paenibacillus sp. 32O-W]